MKSMTGFAKVEKNSNGVKATVEIKSLNNRYLDITCKIPRSISSYEMEIRDLVKNYIARGNVSVYITTELDETIKPFNLNEKVAVGIYNSLVSLAKKLKIKSPVTISDILAFPNYLLVDENSQYDVDIEWKVVKDCLTDALRKLDEYRLQEGKNLYQDITNRTKKLQAILNKIEKTSSNRIEIEREKLRQKIALLFESDEIDENRLQMEILLMANRLDITEECTRLHSHLKFLKEALKSREPVGQKINFILQEINREFNTIGSKSDNAEISQLVVNAKEELEKIREQIQNIE
jgi:uncharacterized protein (TIGR00255 family)